MPNLDETIRERAYYLWSADGQPEGKADVYWLNAQRDVLTTSLESSSNSATIAPTDPVSATTKPAKKPAKKAKVARPRKGKTRAA